MVIRVALSALGFLALAAVGFGLLRILLHRASAAQGDPELAAELDNLAGRHTRRLAAVVIDLDAAPRTRMAFIDAGPDTPFEIGSVTKALTGMLLAQSIEVGETSLDTQLAMLLPETAAGPVGSLTLGELCTHTSGLPRLPRSPAMLARLITSGYFGGDPYRATTPAGVVTAGLGSGCTAGALSVFQPRRGDAGSRPGTRRQLRLRYPTRQSAVHSAGHEPVRRQQWPDGTAWMDCAGSAILAVAGRWLQSHRGRCGLHRHGHWHARDRAA